MIEDKGFPTVSVVVIGLNEAKNLEESLRAVLASDYDLDRLELIYVDSGSTDGSVEIARRYTNRVFIDPGNYPTTARARNRGIVEATGKIVHLVDGDVVMDPHYLKRAVRRLEKGDVHAVCGRLEERNPVGFNRLMAASRATTREGLVATTQAGGTFLRDCLVKVDGYDERIAIGEEMEFCERFRAAGYKIWQIDATMGVHDYDINGWSRFLQLFYRRGKGQVHKALIEQHGPFFSGNLRKLVSNTVQNVLGATLILILGFVGALELLPFFWVSGAAIVVGRCYSRGMRDPAAYGFHLLMHGLKPVTFMGNVVALLRLVLSPSARAMLAHRRSIPMGLPDRMTVPR